MESRFAQFRGEFFNAINHFNPNNPNTTLNSAQFRKITGVPLTCGACGCSVLAYNARRESRATGGL
jgi:hypothetical protein